MMRKTFAAMEARETRIASVVALAAAALLLASAPAMSLDQAASLFLALVGYTAAAVVARVLFKIRLLALFLFSAGFVIAAVVVSAVAVYGLIIGEEE
jgi:hypothetical protein